MSYITHLMTVLGQSRILAQVPLFWRWWTGELQNCIPRRVIEWFADPQDTLIVRPVGDTLVFSKQGMPDSIRSVVLDGTTTLPPLHDPAVRDSAAILLLPAETVLRRAVDLPAEALADIGTALPFLVERHTPFVESAARYTYRAIGRKTKQLMTIEVAVTSRAAVERMEAALSACCVNLTSIRVAGDLLQPHLELMPRRGVRNAAWRREPSLKIALASLLVMVLGPLFITKITHQKLVRETAEMRHNQAGLKTMESTKRAFKSQFATTEFFRTLATQPARLELLTSLTNSIPDSSWLFRIDIDPKTVHLAGYSHDVPIVLRRLQSLPWVRSVEFQSPVVHDPSRVGDRFELMVQIRGTSS